MLSAGVELGTAGSWSERSSRYTTGKSVRLVAHRDNIHREVNGKWPQANDMNKNNIELRRITYIIKKQFLMDLDAGRLIYQGKLRRK